MSMTIERPEFSQSFQSTASAATADNRSFVRQAVDALGAVALLGVGYVHMIDVRGKLSETPYLGVGYILLIITTVIAAGMIVRGNTKGWMLGGAAAAATFVGYCLSRSVGLPAATDDIGNWGEAAGVSSNGTSGWRVASPQRSRCCARAWARWPAWR